MAELKVTFELSERDVNHLRSVIRRSTSAALKKDEAAVIGSALVMAREVRKFKPPDYVLERAERIEELVDVLNDEIWAAPSAVRRKILGALAYFSEPEDLITDTVPGLGFLDDAIMIELVTRELAHELAAWRTFCSFRSRAGKRVWTRSARAGLAERLRAKRRDLRQRVERDEARAAKPAGKGRYRLW